MPISAIFKKFQQFFQITNPLSRKSQGAEPFQFSWAIILFKTQAGRKMPRLPILEKNKDLFKDNIYFSKQTKILIVLRIPKQYEILTHNLDKKCQIVLLKSFTDFFARSVIFFQKKLKFWTFEDCMSNNNFWKAFWRKTSMYSVFENFQVFVGKKHLFSQKIQIFERLQNTWPTVKFETYLKKNLRN